MLKKILLKWQFWLLVLSGVLCILILQDFFIQRELKTENKFLWFFSEYLCTQLANKGHLDYGTKLNLAFLVGEQNLPLSLQEYKNLIKENPKNAEVYYLLSSNYFMKKSFGEAIKEIHKAIELEPSNPQYRFALGFFYEKNGDLKNALKSYKKALEIYPKNGIYQNVDMESWFPKQIIKSAYLRVSKQLQVFSPLNDNEP
jgi:tetratricopeptide (TPR) repeat protein